MAEDKQGGGASDVIAQGASAAQTVRSAVKTGKAIAGAAKGAAAGGPYGAIAMGLWQNKKLVGKIILAAVFIMMLPILFILMLPALIFGGLRSTESPEIPIMNDNAAIYANIEEVGDKVHEVLAGAHDDVLSTIQRKIDALYDDDEHEIIDNFELDAAVDTNILISQYCAHKDDYEEIDTDDLISIIKKHKGELFSYAETVESREVKTEDETITVHKHTYTVSFVGADYFADEVFKLDEEQAELARDYAENLVIFLDERDNETVSGNGTHLNISDLLKDDVSLYPGDDFYPVITNWRSHVSSEFGNRSDPFTKQTKFHTGIDIGVPKGTPIYAAADGTVLYTKKVTTGYGYHVVINHGGKITTLYAHCSKLLVAGGDTVKKGDTIAEVGSTGRSTGPHLHFEVLVDGVLKNPREYLP